MADRRLLAARREWQKFLAKDLDERDERVGKVLRQGYARELWRIGQLIQALKLLVHRGSFYDLAMLKSYGVEMSEEVLKALDIIPYPFDLLCRVADSYDLFPDPGPSILSLIYIERMDQLVDDPLGEANGGHRWYRDELFAKQEDAPTWRLVRKYPLSTPLAHEWSQCVSQVPRSMYVLTPRQVVFWMALHLMRYGENLGMSTFGACAGDQMLHFSASYYGVRIARANLGDELPLAVSFQPKTV